MSFSLPGKESRYLIMCRFVMKTVYFSVDGLRRGLVVVSIATTYIYITVVEGAATIRCVELAS